MDQFGVTSTPTFFANGTIQRGASSFEEFEKFLAPHIKN
jgi:protein-disulfide isomerase